MNIRSPKSPDSIAISLVLILMIPVLYFYYLFLSKRIQAIVLCIIPLPAMPSKIQSFNL